MQRSTYRRDDTVLVMDDDSRRHDRFAAIDIPYRMESTFTAVGAIEKMGCAIYHMVCLDHDLGTFDDGRTVARWLKENPARCPKRVIIHSQNIVGALQMYDLINDIPSEWGITVRMFPFKGANKAQGLDND